MIRTCFVLIIAFLSFYSCSPKVSAPNANEENITARTSESPNQIFLVRHAEKSKNDPRDPDLSEAGKKRAERLKFHLANAGITQIYTSDYKRTKQTVQPLAEYLGLTPIIYNTDLVEVTDLLKQNQQGNILVAGHSNTTPKLANRLLNEEKYKQLDESIYDRLFLITKIRDQYSSMLLRF